MKDDLLKAGSSAMLMFSIPTVPDRIERLRSHNFTWRPKAFVASDSIFGRKLFTLIRNGSATISRRKTATTIPPTRNQRFFIITCSFLDTSSVPVRSVVLWVGFGSGEGR